MTKVNPPKTIPIVMMMWNKFFWIFTGGWVATSLQPASCTSRLSGPTAIRRSPAALNRPAATRSDLYVFRGYLWKENVPVLSIMWNWPNDRYPFVGDSSLTNSSRSFKLPASIVKDENAEAAGP